jgi:transposase
LKKQMAALKEQRRDEMVRGEEPDIEKIRRLRTLKSYGEESSWVTVREFFGWRKFHNGGLLLPRKCPDARFADTR